MFEGRIGVPGMTRLSGVLARGAGFEQQIATNDWFQTLTLVFRVRPRDVKPFGEVGM